MDKMNTNAVSHSCIVTYGNQKTNFRYTRCITPMCVKNNGAHLRGLAPKQHSSEETSQRWRAVGDTVPDLTGPGIELRPRAPIALSSTTMPTDQLARIDLNLFLQLLVKRAR